MSRIQHFLLVCLLILAASGLSVIAATVHFTGFTENTGSNLTLVVPTTANPKIGLDPLAAGDEIGVFTPGGLLIGAEVWDGVNNIAITVWGDNDQTVPVDGAQNGETLNFRVWDASANIEFTSVTVSYSSGNGQYSKDAFFILGSLVAAAKPGKPSFTNPTNNAVGVALSGNLTWNAAAGATTHTIQLSTVNTFATTIINTSGNITSAAYSGLSFNTTYFARARGTNAEGDGDFETISFKTLLPTPTLLSPADNAKNISEASVNLSWNSAAGATSYLVQLSTTANFTAGVVDQTVAGTTATFNGLNNFTDYFWRVQAKDGVNTSAFSTSRTFKTRVGLTTITNPANNAVGVALSGNLMWSAVTGATSYDVLLVKLPNTTVISQNTANTQLAYSNLENFTNYEVRVTAKNADGSGGMATGAFRTILGVPTLLTPANNSFNNALAGNVTWSAVTGAANYDVRIATDAGFNNIIASQNDLAVTTFGFAGLVTNQKYFWQVRAKNAEGTSAFSSAFGFTTVLAQATLIAPANNATQIPLNTTLSWNAVSGATLYHVQVATNANFTTLIFENESVAALSVALNNLNGKTNYFFRVHGYNASNEGPFSNANMFTTVLSKVILLTPADLTQGMIAANGNLTWQAQGGATGYDLLVSTNSNLSNPVISVSTVNAAYAYAGLNNNTTYFWAVRSKDNDGVGPYSDTWSFGTQIPAPTLLTPANNAINVVLQGSCTWTSVAEATTYQLQIATDAGFNTVVFNQTGIVGTTGNYSALENDKVHFWRVRGFKAAGAGIWSNAFTFTTMSIAPPVLVFPPNNSIDLFTSVNLVWNPANLAIAYNVRVATDAGFINIVAMANNLNQTQFTASGLFIIRDYYWQVQTVGAQGVSNWSNAFKFTTLDSPVINGLQTVCENKSATYSTSVSPLIDYHWSVTGGTIVGSSTGNSVNVNWGAAGQGTVNLSRTSAAWGNYTDGTSMNVTKTSVASVVVTLNANTYYPNKACLNEWVNLSSAVNSNGIFTYSWKLNNVVISTSSSFMYHFTTVGTFVFTLTATGLDCEAGQEVISVVVDGNCPVTIINEDDIYTCQYASPVLTTAVIGGSGQFTYAWTPAADLVNASVVSPIVISSVISKTYKLTLLDIVSGLYYYDLVDLIVRNSPSASFSPSSLVVRNSSPVDLTDPGTLSITVTGGTAPYSYSWRDNNGNPIDPSSVQPVIGSNRYYLTVTDANGCSSVEKRLVVIRFSSKEVGDNDIVAGLSGDGYMLSYPNPVTDDLNIVAEFGESQNVRVRVLNLLGQEVFSLNLGSLEIYEGSLDLSQLTSGSYTLILESDTNIFVKSFIKQ